MSTRFTLKRHLDVGSPSSPNNEIVKKSRRTTEDALFNTHDLKALLPTFDTFLASKRPKRFRVHLMNLKDKLQIGKYADARDCVEDVWTTFENVRLSNTESAHYTESVDTFQHEISSVMVRLGYCCGKSYRFNPQTLCCSLKEGCTIAVDAIYFTCQIRHNICDACFTDIPGETVTLAEKSASPTRIRKAQFTKVQNNVTTPELLVDCQDCGRRQHKICVLYSEKIWRTGFVCDSCLASKRAKRDENPFRAKDLPTTKLDVHIETRVNDFLEKRDGGPLHIRMLLNTDRKVAVKPAMRNLYVESGELSATFPYRSKAIFAFQEIDGVDVCFFGMYVQEYGSECPDPNKRRIYVQFLDSVNFFPKRYRTDVYHEILLGYMDFVKGLGFQWLHIWACPPPPLGENYIFYKHPADQKSPDSSRLHRWYTDLFRKAKTEHIIADYKNILQQYRDDNSQLTPDGVKTKKVNIVTATQLPYFDEDYWPYFFDETIQEIDEKLSRAKSKIIKKRNSKRKNNRSDETARLNRQRTGLSSKLFSTMTKIANEFFSIQLHSTQSAATLTDPIQDPDDLKNSEIMNGHSAFFDFARDNSYEFSSLRRAKFSTMCILYELHNPVQYWCNLCAVEVQTVYHCRVCDDFDLCTKCYEKSGHVHEMHKIVLNSGGDETSPSDLRTPMNGSITEPPTGLTVNLETSEQFIPAITTHAFHCSDGRCQIPACQMTRQFANHVKFCQKTSDNCHICKTLNTLLSSHSGSCRKVNCLYSFCKNSRAQIQRQQQQQREKQHTDMMMSMATTFQKMSLKFLDNRKSWTDPLFMLNIASDISKAQILFQEIIGPVYTDLEAQIRIIGTAASMARNPSPFVETAQIP